MGWFQWTVDGWIPIICVPLIMRHWVLLTDWRWRGSFSELIYIWTTHSWPPSNSSHFTFRDVVEFWLNWTALTISRAAFKSDLQHLDWMSPRCLWNLFSFLFLLMINIHGQMNGSLISLLWSCITTKVFLRGSCRRRTESRDLSFVIVVGESSQRASKKTVIEEN